MNMAHKLIPRPGYLLRLAAAYALVAFLCGIAFLLITGLIARPVGTLLFLAGMATGAAVAYYGVRALRSSSSQQWWTSLSHPF
jgi:hypothetical protein